MRIDVKLSRRLGLIGLVTTVTGAACAAATPEPSGFRLKSPFAYERLAGSGDWNGEFLVTASKGAQITVWDLRGAGIKGQTLPVADEQIWLPEKEARTIRGYAAAISPDSRVVAASLPPLKPEEQIASYQPGTARITFYERRSNGPVLAGAIDDLPTPVARMRFSPDGSKLAAILSDGCGLRLWDISRSAEGAVAASVALEDDADYGDASTDRDLCKTPDPEAGYEEKPDNRDVLFVESGGESFIAVSGDRGLRLYRRDAAGRYEGDPAMLSADALGLRQPAAIAASSDAVLAVGDSRGLKIAIVRIGRPDGGFGLDVAGHLDFSHVVSVEVDGPSAPNLRSLAWTKANGLDVLVAGGHLPLTTLNDELLSAGYVERTILAFDNVQHMIAIPARVALEAGSRAGEQLRAGKDFHFIRAGASSVAELLSHGGTGPVLALSKRRLDIATADSVAAPTAGEIATSTHQLADARTFNVGTRATALYVSDDASRVIVTAISGVNRFAAFEFSLPDMQLRVIAEGNTTKIDEMEHVGGEVGKAVTEGKLRAPETEGLTGSFEDERLGAMLYKYSEADPDPKRHVLVSGRPLRFSEIWADQDERSLSFAKLPARERDVGAFAWGTNNALHVVDATGLVRCRLETEAGARLVAPSGDGRIVVVAHGDGSIRWYRRMESAPRDGACLAPMLTFAASQGRDGNWSWVAWRPDGRLAFRGGSPKDMVCWLFRIDGANARCESGTQIWDMIDDEAVKDALAIRNDVAPQSADGPDFTARLLRPAPGNDVLRSTIEEMTFSVAAGRTAVPAYVVVSDGVGSIDVSDLNGSGDAFPDGRAVPITDGTTVLKLVLPPRLRRAEGQRSDLCVKFFDSVDAHGRALVESERFEYPSVSKNRLCQSIIWEGPLSDAPERKLWGLFLGFSDAPLTAMRLNYGHDDALDFAKLLLSTFAAQKRDPTLTDSDFTAVQLDILVTPPGSWNAHQSTAEHAKVSELKQLREALNDEPATRTKADIKLHDLRDVILSDGRMRAADAVYDIVSTRISERASEIGDDDVVLFYYSGHGFTDAADKSLNLALPDGGPLARHNNLRLIDLMNRLVHIKGSKVVIIDACRNPIGTYGAIQRFDTNSANVTLSKGFEVFGQAVHFLMSTSKTDSSYEQNEVSIAHLYPDLWSERTRESSKGNGLFTLGLLYAMVCPEADKNSGEEPMRIDQEEIVGFQREYLQSSQFEHWERIRSRLGLSEAMSWENGRSENVPDPMIYRTLPGAAAKCFVVRPD